MNATDIIRYIDTHCGYYSYFRIVLISHWLLYKYCNTETSSDKDTCKCFGLCGRYPVMYVSVMSRRPDPTVL